MRTLQIENNEENVLQVGRVYDWEGIMNRRKGVYLGTVPDGRIKYKHHLLVRTIATNSWDRDNIGLLRFRDYELSGSTLVISNKTQNFAKLRENEKRFYKDLLKKLVGLDDEEMTLKVEEVYDCMITTLYGHSAFSGRGIYLGRTGHKNKLHKFAYKDEESPSFPIVIKFSDSKLTVNEDGTLEIDGFNRIYGLSDDEERQILSELIARRL